MLAEEHRVVARRFGVEEAVAVAIRLHVSVARHVAPVTVRPVVHRLDAANVAGEARIIAQGPVIVAKEVGGHMLHRVKAKPITLGRVERVHRRARQIGFHQLRHRLAVRAVEPMPAAAD